MFYFYFRYTRTRFLLEIFHSISSFLPLLSTHTHRVSVDLEFALNDSISNNFENTQFESHRNLVKTAHNYSNF